MVDDERQALPCPRDCGPGSRTAVPADDVDASVLVGDEGGEALLERLVHVPVESVAVEAVPVDEAAVEGREQAPALAPRNLHRPAQRRARRLVTARVVRE